jgi:tetratricopeptide (TPR) repeat protein
MERSANSQLDPLKVAALTVDFLTTQTSGSSTLDQARDLSRLMLSMGVGLLPPDTQWDSRLKEFALSQAEVPEYVPVSPLIRWAIELETAAFMPPLADRQLSLERVLRENPDISGFDLNHWAYFLLNLQIFRSAVPLAMRALITAGRPEYFPERVRPLLSEGDHAFNLAAARDTLGWGLCFEGSYADAEKLLSQSLEATSPYSSGYGEVQYHLTHALFWGGAPQRAIDFVQEMQNKHSKNIWTQRAADVVSTVSPSNTPIEKRNYDVVISFAGEDRNLAQAIATRLVDRGLRVFYDDFERSVLWGHNLYEYLTDLYQNRARYCVVLVSRHYANKRWTRLEWKAIQARCFRECEPYCLPVRLDDTELPGLLPTTAYLSLDHDGVDSVVTALLLKLGKPSSAVQ